MTAYFETREWDGTVRKRWDLAAGVELVDPLPDPEETWDRVTVSNQVVDGEFETHSSLGRMLQPMSLVVRGATRALCEATYQALKADVYKTHRLQLHIYVDGIGKTYRAYRPDVVSPPGMSDVEPEREVLVTWRVLPHPTITGV